MTDSTGTLALASGFPVSVVGESSLSADTTIYLGDITGLIPSTILVNFG